MRVRMNDFSKLGRSIGPDGSILKTEGLSENFHQWVWSPGSCREVMYSGQVWRIMHTKRLCHTKSKNTVNSALHRPGWKCKQFIADWCKVSRLVSTVFRGQDNTRDMHYQRQRIFRLKTQYILHKGAQNKIFNCFYSWFCGVNINISLFFLLFICSIYNL